ncbi:hypothetical protein PYW08_003977 [Mythimna loreyi]|uniref:Uncharacterized protein n=1 Tax=Mythimna loreyi TaxID=667449 RepID=A0ACC2QU47_9NEOP|nr:hypothetical protein PYW08_003977 [Mythimna loreyi]
MASRIFLFGLLVSLITVSYIECRGHGGHSSSHSSGHSSGHSGGHSSGHSSGHGWGHSGSSSSHSYPSSSSGLSGYGSGSSWSHGSSSSGSGYHSYPSGNGLSGYHSSGNNHYYSSRTRMFNRNGGHYSTHYGTSNGYYTSSSYYTAPEYIYINEYRHSNSRYGDLLTGLSLYNYGRSQSRYYDHYYYDDYYRRRYNNPISPSHDEEYKPQDWATCILKVKENGREEVLKIPCEIVSTFTEESKKVDPSQQPQVNITVCTWDIKRVNNTPELRNSAKTYSKREIKSESEEIYAALGIDTSALNDLNAALESIKSMNSDDRYDRKVTPIINFTMPDFNFTMPDFDFHSKSSDSASDSSMLPTESPESTVTTVTTSLSGSVTTTTTTTTIGKWMTNVTVCITNSTLVDPLTVQGPPIDSRNMECFVEIVTSDAYLSNVIDCNTLLEYAKLPEPKKDVGILPERQKLKSWLTKPPWWMSLFIAV